MNNENNGNLTTDEAKIIELDRKITDRGVKIDNLKLNEAKNTVNGDKFSYPTPLYGNFHSFKFEIVRINRKDWRILVTATAPWSLVYSMSEYRGTRAAARAAIAVLKSYSRADLTSMLFQDAKPSDVNLP